MPISEWMQAVRNIVGHELVVMVGASAIVVDDNGRILLQQRSDNHQWGIPGGAIEPGEEPATAAIRETYEETGLHVEIIRLIGVFGGRDQVRQYPNGDKMAYISVTFECRVIGGEINPDHDESLDVQWFDTDNLPKGFMAVHQRRVVACLSNNIPFFDVPEIDFSALTQANYIGQIRQKIGNTLIMMPGTLVLVFDDAGELLVHKRGDIAQWGLPGGYYEVGEEPAETAIREVYEETGLEICPIRLAGVYGGEMFNYTYPNGDKVASITMVFVAEIVGGKLLQETQESLKLRFVDPHNLPEPILSIHRLIIDHALNRTDPYFAI